MITVSFEYNGNDLTCVEIPYNGGLPTIYIDTIITMAQGFAYKYQVPLSDINIRFSD